MIGCGIAARSVITSCESPSIGREDRHGRVRGRSFGGEAMLLILRIVRRVAEPQAMQEDRELAGDGDDRALLGILPAAVRDRRAEPPEITLGPKRPKDVMRGVDQ